MILMKFTVIRRPKIFEFKNMSYHIILGTSWVLSLGVVTGGCHWNYCLVCHWVVHWAHHFGCHQVSKVIKKICKNKLNHIFVYVGDMGLIITIKNCENAKRSICMWKDICSLVSISIENKVKICYLWYSGFNVCSPGDGSWKSPDGTGDMTEACTDRSVAAKMSW